MSSNRQPPTVRREQQPESWIEVGFGLCGMLWAAAIIMLAMAVLVGCKDTRPMTDAEKWQCMSECATACGTPPKLNRECIDHCAMACDTGTVPL